MTNPLRITPNSIVFLAVASFPVHTICGVEFDCAASRRPLRFLFRSVSLFIFLSFLLIDQRLSCHCVISNVISNLQQLYLVLFAVVIDCATCAWGLEFGQKLRLAVVRPFGGNHNERFQRYDPRLPIRRQRMIFEKPVHPMPSKKHTVASKP